MANLQSALEEALEMNRADAIAAAEGAPYEYEEVKVNVAAVWCERPPPVILLQ